jgi:hypothetical protein
MSTNPVMGIDLEKNLEGVRTKALVTFFIRSITT